MIYYLPVSEHKMRKILPLLVSSKALTAQQVKVNFRSLRVSYTARNILFCTSAVDFIADRRSANVVVRSLNCWERSLIYGMALACSREQQARGEDGRIRSLPKQAPIENV